MFEREIADQKARDLFEGIWKTGDYWDLEHSAFEQAKFGRQLAMLQGRRYARALEIGCGGGCFTRLLSGVADQVVALDVAPSAIERARAIGVGPGTVEFRMANVMEYEPRTEGPWDLVVISETIYYLGWLYTFFDVGWLAAELFFATLGGGRLLMANTCGGVEDYLVLPWLIRTYRDLFLNVGYSVEAEETFRGTKEGVDIEVLITLFQKPPETERGSAAEVERGRK